MSNNENSYIENIGGYFAPITYYAAAGTTVIALTWGARKFAPSLHDGGTTLANAIHTAGSTLAGGIYNAGSTLLDGGYNLLSYPLSGIYNAGSTLAGGIYNAGSTLLDGGYNLLSYTLQLVYNIVTLPYTAVKHWFYGNLTLAGGATIGDLAISYNKQELKFDLFDKYKVLFDFQKDLISSALDKMPDPKNIYDFINKTIIPDIAALIEKSIKMYHEYQESSFKLEQKFALNKPVNNKYLGQLSDTNDNQQTNTVNSYDTNSKQIPDQNSKENHKEIKEIINDKEYITLKLNLDYSVEEIMHSLVGNGVKLYVTKDELSEIEKFFKKNEVELDLDTMSQKLPNKCNNNDDEVNCNFLHTVWLYEAVKNLNSIPEEYQYCDDEVGETGCSQKPIVKIVHYCSNLVDEKLNEVNKINSSIMTALKDGAYTKEQVMESIRHCNDDKYDELICSPLFEGAANEYFDSITS